MPSALSDAQTVIRGQVVDGETGDAVFAAGVLVQGSTTGTSTDFDGRFRLEVASLPVTLYVSFIGYATLSIDVRNASRMSPRRAAARRRPDGGGRGCGVADRRAPEARAADRRGMDVLAIKEAPSGNFYEGLGNLKGVDLTSASLGFKIINTRGFNSTSPVRSLQLIDGVDNQSPGLNYSLGNFLGAPELDVMKVDIVAGASSAFYGPGAFNGVVSMETKSPFRFPGVSVSAKAGERNLTEMGFRYADYITDKEDNPVLGFKVNAFRFDANDWVADNYNPVDGANDGADNPGGFDAVNIYGDEYRTVFDYSGDNSSNARGLGSFYRTGYREIDLVDYGTENLKVSTALHLRLQPEKTYESAELVYGFNSGFGTTVYQGDNRFSLRDIEFYQHKIQLSKPGKWFVRAYRTSEDAGNSYDPYATALRLQEESRSDYSHSRCTTGTGSTALCRASTRVILSWSKSGWTRITASRFSATLRAPSMVGTRSTPTRWRSGTSRSRIGPTTERQVCPMSRRTRLASSHRERRSSRRNSTAWWRPRTTKRRGAPGSMIGREPHPRPRRAHVRCGRPRGTPGRCQFPAVHPGQRRHHF